MKSAAPVAARGALTAACLAALGGAPARAQTLGATLEPSYSHVETEVSDQGGVTSRRVTDTVTQNYRLSLDAPLTRYLVAAAGGTLLLTDTWGEVDDVSFEEEGREDSLYARLSLGTPVLSAGVAADRRRQRAGASSTAVTESFSGYATWRPLELPEIDLRLGHTNAYDTARRVQDTSTDTAVVTARYTARQYELRYVLDWYRTSDDLRDSVATEINQTVFGTYLDTLFRGRTSLYLSGRFAARNVSIVARGPNATVTRQQFPAAGLSGIEVFPATAEDIVLTPNPQLVDGNTTVGASVNVGFGPSAAGDRDRRDVGARFADQVTPVTTIHVWVDKRLPAEVGSALAASMQVYRSADNRAWTAVPLSAPPVVSAFENRIEITIPEVQASHLKVTLQPLALGVTTDPAYRSILVTEIRFLLVLPASEVDTQQSSTGFSTTGSARTTILRVPDLTWDLTASVAGGTETDVTTWSLLNGLSLAHPLSPRLATNARVARTDYDSGRGREASTNWSAGLIGRPYPTAYWTVTYSGSRFQRNVVDPSSLVPGATVSYVGETTLSNAISALGRADWYDGISTQGNVGASLVTRGGRDTRALNANASLSLTPNPVATLTLGGAYTLSETISPDQESRAEFLRVEAGLALYPTPALSATGTVSRVVVGDRPTTLATVQVNYFPLRGDLQLSCSYQRTLDTEAGTLTDLLAPSLRWNLRRGASLTGTYTYLKAEAPVQTLVSRAVGVALLIAL
jgi:hypothetical protein